MKTLPIAILLLSTILVTSSFAAEPTFPNWCEIGAIGRNLLQELSDAVDEVHKYDKEFFKDVDDVLDATYLPGKTPESLLAIWTSACKNKITKAAQALKIHAHQVYANIRGAQSVSQIKSLLDWGSKASVVSDDFIKHCNVLEQWNTEVAKFESKNKNNGLKRSFDERLSLIVGTIKFPIYKTPPHQIREILDDYDISFNCSKMNSQKVRTKAPSTAVVVP